MSNSIMITLKLPNQPGMLAKILTVISEEGGSLGAIDLISASPTYLTRELMVKLSNESKLPGLISRLKAMDKIEVLHIKDRVFTSHQGGKIEITPKKPIRNWDDLSLVYTPGVAKISEAIAKDHDLVYNLTMKGTTVAIVTDGSAILGLGNLGAAPALPVMEGKAALFKQFADINAVPLCLNTQDPQQIIDTVVALAPSFGGINLEDIAAPKCFEIEEKLSQLLDIPVFHDDQHGTAVVTLAGLINALKVVGKNIKEIKVVISGAGAAGTAICKILLQAGVRNIIVCNRKGAIARDKVYTASSLQWIAQNTNEQCEHGALKDVIVGADVFIGVSGPGVLDRSDVERMAKKPVVFALANPQPEIMPEEISDIAGVIATGRSDYPNQINNALAFPGIFRGALDCHARKINHEMCVAAAYALANTIKEKELSAENIIPSVFNNDVVPAVARAVQKAAETTGVCRKLSVLKEDTLL
ncbi:NAD-dependent malic enzyme [Desulfotomaculum nigrificans]|uniref:NAD-dependent malic enzyme n=1 Tax=Desulfotomaculum nigrificans TaxID=1565 RepID=UPI0001FAE8D2|nr:NAD-dependent malic enzyme [Desulfotomaculum nigrificans]